jgi:hypothetical protein
MVGHTKVCNALSDLSPLGVSFGALCHFIATAMGEEHMKRMKDDPGVRTAFISTPIQLKTQPQVESSAGRAPPNPELLHRCQQLQA